MTATRAQRIHDAAINQVAAASIAYQEELDRLRYVLGLAHGHGLTPEEMVATTGLPEAFVQQLLEEAAG